MLKRFLKIWIVFLFCMIISNFSFAGTLSSDIDGINEASYPGIKNLIKNMQGKHGNYSFQVYYTGIDWTEAVTMEYQGHGSSPKNLFSLSKNYKGKWYCPICGSKTYDTGWYCASREAIEYMMDPRNSLDETSIFQFKNLEISDVTAENIRQVINSKYSTYSYINNDTMINAIVNASAGCNLNGYSILAKIINEQGKGTSVLATGEGYNGYGVGYYNFFNVGAYGNGISTVLTNGLKYAINKGWNSVESSVFGGSEYYKSSYIGRGQNTLYYQRFNVVYEMSLFSHQYQQDIMGAQTSSTLMKNYYDISNTTNTTTHVFIIPLYENMPAVACARPSTTENNNVEFEEAEVLTNKLAVRAAPNSNRIISYLNKNEKIKVIERAKNVSSDGNYWDIIVSNTDGTYGYVPRIDISKENNFPRYVFDYKYYADNNPDLKAIYGYNENKLYRHFIENGAKEGRSSSAVFNTKYYLVNNPDLKIGLKNDYINACNHFANKGYTEYRKSSPEYDGSFYKLFYPDLSNLNSIQLMEHYMDYGKSEGRLGGLDAEIENILFNEKIYADCNQDLKLAFGNNKELLRNHWISYGIKEGRIASLLYNAEIYYRLNSDLQKIFQNKFDALFIHFVNYGINEGRVASLIFNPITYFALNQDVEKALQTNCKQAYLHFMNNGMKEGRVGSEVFSAKAYLAIYNDLKLIFINDYSSACVHFLNYGLEEGRVGSDMFNVLYYKDNYSDLRNIYINNYKEYYIHYILHGRTEGRIAFKNIF